MSGFTVARSSGSNSSCFQPLRSMASFWMMDTVSSANRERTSPSHLASTGAERPEPAPRRDEPPEPELAPSPPVSS
ncbi:hypothetical protein D3C76_1713840 [compost metagenome]